MAGFPDHCYSHLLWKIELTGQHDDQMELGKPD
jgi:hypothetical protein